MDPTFEIKIDFNSKVHELKKSIKKLKGFPEESFYLKNKEAHIYDKTLKENGLDEKNDDILTLYFFEENPKVETQQQKPNCCKTFC